MVISFDAEYLKLIWKLIRTVVSTCATGALAHVGRPLFAIILENKGNISGKQSTWALVDFWSLRQPCNEGLVCRFDEIYIKFHYKLMSTFNFFA